MINNIGSRVSRILSGTVNALVDSVEAVAPEIVMEQAVREVDQAIDDVRAELGKAISSRHLASRRLAEENRKHEDLTANIELAVAEGRDDLAEPAVAQLLDIEAQIPVLEHTIVDAEGAEKELEAYVAALQGRKREMQAELRRFKEMAKPPVGGAGGEPGGQGSSVEKVVEDAESAFDRVLENATGLPGRVSPGDRAQMEKVAELEELARKNRIQERLAGFKAKERGV